MHPVWQGILGLLLGDVLVATGHWFEDQYFDQHTPYIGTIGRYNVFHHYLPFAMTSYSGMDQIKATLPLTMVGVALLWCLAPGFVARYPVLVATTAVVTVMSNFIHSIQHERPYRQPRWFTTLASIGLLESSAHHKRHHDNPQHRYGVVLGFMNPVYDGIGLWRFLEMVVPLDRRAKRPFRELEPCLPQDIRDAIKTPCPEHVSRQRLNDMKRRLLERP